LSLAVHILLWAACALRGPTVELDDRWTTPPQIEVAGGEVTIKVLPPPSPPTPEQRPVYKPESSNLPEPASASATAPADAARAIDSQKTGQADRPAPVELPEPAPSPAPSAVMAVAPARPIARSDQPGSAAPPTPPVELTRLDPAAPTVKVDIDAPPAETSTAVVSTAQREGVRDATLRKPPSPRYPARCVRRGQEGVVVLRVHVLADGSVESVKVEKSSGVALLDAEAVRAMKRACFRPAERSGQPVAAWVTQPVRFTLRS
jgi:protein TonB